MSEQQPRKPNPNQGSDLMTKLEALMKRAKQAGLRGMQQVRIALHKLTAKSKQTVASIKQKWQDRSGPEVRDPKLHTAEEQGETPTVIAAVADDPDQSEIAKNPRTIAKGTAIVAGGIGKLTATVKTVIDNKRRKSSMYKPYQYKGVQSRLKRHSRQKVYRLKGYTTVARVNRKRRREYIRRQRNILLISAAIIVAIIVIFMWIDPIPKLNQLLHDLGFLSP